jgi:hypothetical protein
MLFETFVSVEPESGPPDHELVAPPENSTGGVPRISCVHPRRLHAQAARNVPVSRPSASVRSTGVGRTHGRCSSGRRPSRKSSGGNSSVKRSASPKTGFTIGSRPTRFEQLYVPLCERIDCSDLKRRSPHRLPRTVSGPDPTSRIRTRASGGEATYRRMWLRNHAAPAQRAVPPTLPALARGSEAARGRPARMRVSHPAPPSTAAAAARPSTGRLYRAL